MHTVIAMVYDRVSRQVLIRVPSAWRNHAKPTEIGT